MIIFNTIKWKNFLSTGNQFTEIELDRHHSTLIQGYNGAGKSTILDAITFVLFNKPFRKINKPQLVNSINEKDCVVQIEFTINGVVWNVVRGIKPNRFEIYKNDILVDQTAAAADQQKWLEQSVLKMNYKAFTQVVILGSSTFVPFMQLTPAYRREVIEDILDIQIFSTMKLLLKDRIRLNFERQKECKYELKSAEDKVKMQEDHIRNSQTTNVGEIDLKIKDISILEEEVFEYNRDINIFEAENLDIHTEIINVDKHKQDLKNANAILNKLQNRFYHTQKDIAFFTENDTCPTCDQIIDSEFKDRKLSELRKSSEQFDNGCIQLQQKIISTNDQLDILIKQESKLKDNLYKINQLRDRIAHNEKNIVKLNSEIQRLNESPNIAMMQGKLEAYKEEYLAIEKRCSDVSKEQSEYDVVANLLKDSGVKAQIIKKYVPNMNRFINKHLTSMDFYVNFTLDEEFNEVIKSRYRDEFTYASFSEGEKQKIDLALLFTWREIANMKNSVSTNLLLLDEVFDSSLDSSATEELMKILHGIDKKTNVFVISHKGEVLTDKFEHNIKFEKVSDFSKIVNDAV